MVILGEASTRYKDILDLFYLIQMGNMKKSKVLFFMECIIFEDNNIKESSINEVSIFLQKLFNKKRYLENFNNIKNNWLEVPIEDVVSVILNFIDSLSVITV